jgi:hypothetical protein
LRYHGKSGGLLEVFSTSRSGRMLLIAILYLLLV